MNFKKDIETSKLLLIQTRAIFICTLIFAIAFSWMGKPLDIFIYAIPASAGCYIAAICFYLNKAKMENIFKGKVEFLKLKLDLLTQYPEQEEVINHEINEIEEALDEGINNKLDEAINTDVKGEVNYG